MYTSFSLKKQFCFKKEKKEILVPSIFRNILLPGIKDIN